MFETSADTKAREKRERRRRRQQGLIGLLGHTFTEQDGARRIQYQFEIIRRLPPDRYVVQLFSWFDGSTTNVNVMTEAELLGQNTELYATELDWQTAYEKDCQRNRWCDRQTGSRDPENLRVPLS
jgi:hypothetical protein